MKAKYLKYTLVLIFSLLVLNNNLLADTPQMLLTGHTDEVYAVVYRPDSDIIATKSRDSTIRLWNTVTGETLRIINTSPRGGIVFSPDGSILASGGGDEKVVNLWNSDTGELIRALRGHTDRVGYVAFSPDGNVLASGSSDGTIRLWNPHTGQLLDTLPADKVYGLVFSNDGGLLANAGEDATVQVWNPQTGELIYTIHPPIHDVFDVAFSPEGSILASAGWAGMDLYDASTGELELSFPRDTGRIYLSVAFSPDGGIIAIGKDAGGIDLWDTNRGTHLNNLGVKGKIVYDTEFSPDGRTLASVGNDNFVRLWEINPPQNVEIPAFPEDFVGPNVNIWTEDFNDGNLDSWTSREHQRERVVWQTIDGKLHVQTQPFCNGRLNISSALEQETNYTLGFTAFPLEVEQVRVKLKLHSTENANVGLYIGNKPDSPFHKVFQHAYLFANHTLGGPDGPGHTNQPEIGMNLTEIDVLFDRGHFYLYSQGEYIVDFPVNGIQQVDYVGIAVFPKRCGAEATVTLDEFEISGPVIPNVRVPKAEPEDINVDKKVDDEDAWIEDFNNEDLSSWKQPKYQTYKRSTWQAKDGLLDVWIQPIPSHALIQTYELEFVGFPIKAESLRVKVDVIEAHKSNVGIFIGQYSWDGGISRRTYKILHKGIWGPIEFKRQSPDGGYGDLKEIEIFFNKGYFELLSEGEHILEFDEPNLKTIDCLGLIAYVTQDPLAHFVMDNFIISDVVEPVNKSLNVQAKGKATLLWGKLKQK